MKIEPNLAVPYLQLMKNCLTRYIFPDTLRTLRRPTQPKRVLFWVIYPSIATILEKIGLKLCRHVKFEPELRAEGLDWPPGAETMIGLRQLDNIQSCIEEILREGVSGDLIEAGVWRGGACIFMRAALTAYGDNSRQIWVADSFEGLPKPDGRYKEDENDRHWTMNHELAVSLDEVKSNFTKYGLLDERVRFLKGWFKDTLPKAPIERLALIRLDGDMYSSIMDSLLSLYPKLSVGGYVIIDDYGGIDACRKAVDEFRASRRIETPIIKIDRRGVYWKKSA